MTLKPRAIAWREKVKIHWVDIDEKTNYPKTNRTLCGIKIPYYPEVWDLLYGVDCKKCLKIKGKEDE